MKRLFIFLTLVCLATTSYTAEQDGTKKQKSCWGRCLDCFRRPQQERERPETERSWDEMIGANDPKSTTSLLGVARRRWDRPTALY